MNAIAMLGALVPSITTTTMKNANSRNASPLFAMLLQQHGNQGGEATLVQVNDSDNGSTNLLELLASMDTNISRLLLNSNSQSLESKDIDHTFMDIESLLRNIESLDVNMESLVKSLRDLVKLEDYGINPSTLQELNFNSEETLTILSKIENDLKEPIQLDQNVRMQETLQQIFTNFESLLSLANTKDELKKIAPQILNLLKQWTAIQKNLENFKGTQGKGIELSDIKINQVWKDILVAYQNRNSLTTKQIYHSNSQVTAKDVVKWLENALQNQEGIDKMMSIQQNSFQSNTVMPKLEQYVIFMNQAQSGQSVDQQLIDQFQQVMKTSKFLSMPNGMNQLSIALRPENLGEMMVRLIEVNGEMTVKIVVSTQAAKDMLESNIGQLKHMFSPQQVVIERQDLAGGQGQPQTKQHDEQSLQGQNQSQSNESDQQQESNNSGENFEAQLEELIQNMEG
ncbi:flagellar hook-length control protein FliK [Ornithinibacillus sp. 179-J 7C1 HS]|uniref:flagellar hook-length control protein FliK n=1 Tax=Ornithinibacillus sp. 179-J 7C1 HS TaxID=3142384 RepID=UPI00399F28F0